MEKELNQIYQKQLITKHQLQTLKNKYLATLYSNKSSREIAKELYKMTINSKVVSPLMYRIAKNSVDRVNKKKLKMPNDTGIGILGVGLLSLMLKLDKKMDKALNEEVREITAKNKDELITKTIEESRKLGKVFYLCSSHQDCAKDHLPYQGKMYVDQLWWQLTHSQEVREYVNSHNIKTVQWVMGKPVWMITRPNCHHYLQALSVDEVLNTSKTKLEKKYKMKHKEPPKEFQTPAKMTLTKYKEMLKTLNAMYYEKPNMILKQRIDKVKMLIKKWENKK